MYAGSSDGCGPESINHHKDQLRDSSTQYECEGKNDTKQPPSSSTKRMSEELQGPNKRPCSSPDHEPRDTCNCQRVLEPPLLASGGSTIHNQFQNKIRRRKLFFAMKIKLITWINLQPKPLSV